jgi:hypothetical protein
VHEYCRLLPAERDEECHESRLLDSDAFRESAQMNESKVAVARESGPH